MQRIIQDCYGSTLESNAAANAISSELAKAENLVSLRIRTEPRSGIGKRAQELSDMEFDRIEITFMPN